MSTGKTRPNSRRAAWRAALCRRFAWLAGLGIVGLTLPWWQGAVPTAPGRWVADLAVHWQWVYGATGVLCAAGCVALAQGRERARGVAACALAVVLGVLNAIVTPLPALPHAPAGGNTSHELKLLTFNVNLDNAELQPMLDWLTSQSPDVLALTEVTPAMQPLLDALAQRYPHAALRPRDDPFGMAVFSRHAWQAARFVADGGAPQRFVAQVQAPGGAFTLHVLHPMPPISAADRAARDALLATIAGEAANAAAPRGAVLVGDLNTTPWASGLRDMAAQGWGRASGLAPTLALGRSLPLDHLLATRAHWQRVAHGAGPWLGSDHRPVWAVLRPAP